jgi:predicted O-methyltransferase YrrM
VRHLKPGLVVETGIHDGLGSTVLLRALEKNAADGAEGSLISFDIDPAAGWLIPDELRHRHDLRVGNSLQLLGKAIGPRSVDFFLHDSDHRYEHETAEFETVLPFVRPGTVLVSDNAHGSRAFADFCGRHDLSYRYFAEIPTGHFYSGAGIGLAVVERPG